MGAIGITQPIIPQGGYIAPANPPAVQAQVALPQQAVAVDSPEQVSAQVATAEQKQFAAVKQASQQSEFNFPIGDKSFTIFRDSSGQYVTRYTSLRDGKITYVPAPNLVGNRPSAYNSPAVNIKA